MTTEELKDALSQWEQADSLKLSAEAINRILAAFDALTAERDGLKAELEQRWRSMETAPKDGSKVLLAYPSNISDFEKQAGDAVNYPPHVATGRWIDVPHERGWWDGRRVIDFDFLGWHPLPPAMKTVPLTEVPEAAK